MAVLPDSPHFLRYRPMPPVTGPSAGFSTRGEIFEGFSFWNGHRREVAQMSMGPLGDGRTLFSRMVDFLYILISFSLVSGCVGAA